MKRIFFLFFLTIFASQALMAQKVVSIYVFGKAPREYKKVIGSKFIAAASLMKGYTIVERTDEFLKALQDEQDFQSSGVASVTSLAEIGEELGANYVIAIELDPVFEAYFVDARMINTKTGGIYASANESKKVDNMAELELLARDISKDLFTQLMQKEKEIDSGSSNSRPLTTREKPEQEDAQAQYKRGDEYFNAKNYTEAVKWYRKAAEQGHAMGQYGLGQCYFSGLGVSEDNYEAVKWFRKAAEQGHAQAQCKLGLCYENGWGIPQDISQAVYWYRKAAAQGSGYAKTRLKALGYSE